ncbi:vitamin D3 receptor-like isoform X1 [Octopus vulgaris]|uniref:Vitamin D3 receptor-like isoform X1 n=1 Tax=Octopus vulgaris TaxID=6645 RepID=A0AA36AL86_OCTVU|nr:vitamin D3 receptor-like isoform X1 [Octopus vulgaris]
MFYLSPEIPTIHTKCNSNKILKENKSEHKRRPKPKDGSKLTCRVCGDVALGYNFDAITCESCKAFFRRNALKKKVFICTFENKCHLDQHTRKFCASCRLKRCFEVGMKKNWILNEDQLKKRRQKLNMAKRNKSKTLHPSLPSPSSSCSSQSNMSVTSNWSYNGSFEYFRDMSPFTCYRPIVESEFRQIILPVDKYSILSDVYWNMLTTNKQGRHILSSLRLLVEHHERLFNNYYRYGGDIISNLPNEPIDYMNRAITLLISFMRSLPEFQALSHEDYMTIFMGNIREVFVIRAAMTFSFRGEYIVFWNQKGQEKCLDPMVLKSALGEKLYNQIAYFIKSFQECTNEDRIIMIMLMLIEFFNPYKPNVENKYFLQTAQEKYDFWLKVYIEAKYPENIASLIYRQIIMKLSDVREIGHICNEASKKFLWEDFLLLIVDILDIN